MSVGRHVTWLHPALLTGSWETVPICLEIVDLSEINVIDASMRLPLDLSVIMDGNVGI